MESRDLKTGRISEASGAPGFDSHAISHRARELLNEIEERRRVCNARADNSDKLEALLPRILAESGGATSSPVASETE